MLRREGQPWSIASRSRLGQSRSERGNREAAPPGNLLRVLACSSRQALAASRRTGGPMKRTQCLSVTFTLVAALLPCRLAVRQEQGFEVTVTNLTIGQQYTPILVASHSEGVHLFDLGSSASSQLATLAQEGNTAPLAALLAGLPEVKDIAVSAGLLDPGKSVTIFV